MKRLRKKERQYLRACINYKKHPNTYKTISNKALYGNTNIKRIDVHLVELAIKFFEKLHLVENQLIDSCGLFNNIYYENPRHKFKVPHCLMYLNIKNKLFDSEKKLIYYNKRHKQLEASESLVYSIQQ